MVPLRYVSAQTVFKLLDAFGVKATTVRPDVGRNTLIITGSGSDRGAAIDTILSFDADWMRGQSVGIFPVRNSSPEPVISEIEKIMDSGEGGLSQNVIKFQPIGRLNSILVVSQKPEYLKRAGVWIARLDKSDTEGVNLKAYPLRYGNSKQIVALLNEMLTGRGPRRQPRQRIQPDFAGRRHFGVLVRERRRCRAERTAADQRRLRRGPRAPRCTADDARPRQPAGAPAARRITGGRRTGGGARRRQAGGGGGILPNVRITADVTNNAVLVYANQESQRVVEQTIRQIDRPQRQIAIEATIAEVTLNDQLNYGVQFFLASQKGSISNTITGVTTQQHHGNSSPPATPSTPPPARCWGACFPASIS